MMTPARSQRTSTDDEDRECVGTVLMVQIVYELFTEVFCLPSLADFVVLLSNGAELCFSASLNSTKNAEFLVELKEAEERSLLRKGRPRDVPVIYSID